MINTLASMFVSPQTMVVIAHLDGRVVDLSPSFESRFGITREQACGKTMRDFGFWNDPNERAMVIELLMKRGTAVRHAISRRGSNGRLFDGLASFELIECAGVRYMLALIQDVREYDDPSDASQRELESFRSLFTEAEIGVYRRWPGSRGWVDANPAFAHMLGYESPATLVAGMSKDPLDLYVDREHGQLVLAELTANSRISRMRSRFRRRDGSSVWISENCRAVKNNSGDLLFYEGTVGDISGIVEAQQAVADSELLYRTLVENTRDGVFLLEDSGLSFCNQALAQSLGYSVSELTGMNYLDLIPEDQVEKQLERRALREAGLLPIHEYQLPFRRKDGSLRLFAIRAGTLILHEKLVTVGTMRDVTDETAQSERLIELTAELEERVNERTAELRAQIAVREGVELTLKNRNADLELANQNLAGTQSQLLQSEKMASVGELAAGVAHEINNPIGYVGSNITTLSRYLQDIFSLLYSYEAMERSLSIEHPGLQHIDSQKQIIDLKFLREDIPSLLSESLAGIARVQMIVKDLKDFSRIGETEWQAADIHNGIESTLNVAAHEIKYKVEIIREFGELPLIECLPFQLNQVFLNLLVNAAHAIQDKGRITIRTRVDGDNVCIQFSDTGKGIQPDLINRIFDPFFTTKPVGVGTGLGLSVTYSIVKRHGGSIAVTSVVDEGTTFTIRLPVKSLKLSV